jgi:hypothetical protein
LAEERITSNDKAWRRLSSSAFNERKGFFDKPIQMLVMLLVQVLELMPVSLKISLPTRIALP